ncbi:MAG: LptF/LptG family permease [Planctomycetota bacterium]
MRRLPWRIYRYIGREIFMLFAVGLLALTLLYVIVIGLKGVSVDLPIGIVAVWVFESIGFSFFFTVPIALLLAGTLTYGRMVSDREYTAITASGMSPLQLFMPMALISGALGGLAHWTHGTVLPDAHFAQRDIASHLVKQIASLGDRFDGQIRIDESDGLVYFDEVRDGKYLRGVHIQKKLPRESFDFSPDGTARQVDPENGEAEGAETPIEFRLEAGRATIEVDEETDKILLSLYDVDLKLANPDQKPLFDKQGGFSSWKSVRLNSYQVEFDSPKTERRRADLRNPQLMAEIEEMRRENDARKEQLPTVSNDEARQQLTKDIEYFDRRIRKYEAEYWQRKALALSVFIFGFLSFPVSLVFRYRHRLSSLFIGVVLVIAIFYPLLLLGETLTVSLGFPAQVGLLLGNAALLAIALALTGKLLLR